MNNPSIEELTNQLQNALNRINELERKVETMRGNINANFNSYASIMSQVVNHTKTPGGFNFFTGIDVARGF